MRTLTNDYFRQIAYIRKAIEEAQAGRTFYEDYFKGKTYKELSRVDRILYLLLEADCGTGLLGEPNEVVNLKYKLADQGRFLENKHLFDLKDEQPLTFSSLEESLEKAEQEKLVYIKILDREYLGKEFTPLEFIYFTKKSLKLLISNRLKDSCTVQQLLQEIKHAKSEMYDILQKFIRLQGFNSNLVLIRIKEDDDFVYLEFAELIKDVNHNCQGEI